MIEKIKAWGTALITAAAFVAGYLIYTLLGKNRSLREDAETAKAENSVAATKAKEEIADAAASDSVSEYNRLRDEYLKAGSSGPSGKLPGSDSGSGQSGT